jgi:hypothetical protein
MRAVMSEPASATGRQGFLVFTETFKDFSVLPPNSRHKPDCSQQILWLARRGSIRAKKETTVARFEAAVEDVHDILFEEGPPLMGFAATQSNTAPQLYDVFGRRFFLGLRYRL